MTERVVVIGGDAARGSAASQVRRGKGDDVHVVMVERGRWTSYSACGIPYWVAGDVLELAADRLPVEEIARRASLSAGTVRNYLSSAASKLGAANRHEAVHVTHFAGGDTHWRHCPPSESSSVNWRSAASSSRRRATRPSWRGGPGHPHRPPPGEPL